MGYKSLQWSDLKILHVLCNSFLMFWFGLVRFICFNVVSIVFQWFHNVKIITGGGRPRIPFFVRSLWLVSDVHLSRTIKLQLPYSPEKNIPGGVAFEFGCVYTKNCQKFYFSIGKQCRLRWDSSHRTRCNLAASVKHCIDDNFTNIQFFQCREI